MGVDREEKRVTGRNEPSQAWEKAAEQLDTNDPNQRRLSASIDALDALDGVVGRLSLRQGSLGAVAG